MLVSSIKSPFKWCAPTRKTIHIQEYLRVKSSVFPQEQSLIPSIMDINFVKFSPWEAYGNNQQKISKKQRVALTTFCAIQSYRKRNYKWITNIFYYFCLCKLRRCIIQATVYGSYKLCLYRGLGLQKIYYSLYFLDNTWKL